MRLARSQHHRRWHHACAALPWLALLPCGGVHAQSITLLPVADATLYSENADAANGAGVSLFAGQIATGDQRRALLRFDLSVLPPGATITAATLELSVTRSIAMDSAFALHRVDSSWGEGASAAAEPAGQGTAALAGDATWTLRFYPDQPWASAGGDVAAAASATTVIAQVRPAWSGPGMVADVQAWLADPAANHGWALLAADDVRPGARRFGSRESPDPSLRPSLQLVYSAPSSPLPNPAPRVIPATSLASVLALALLALASSWLLLRPSAKP